MDTLERHQLEPDSLTTTESLPSTAVEPTTAPAKTLTDRIPGWLALGTGALWLSMLVTIEILAPAASDDPGALAVTIGVIFEIVLLATIIGLASRRRWGLMTSMAGGVVLLGASAMCSLEGHVAAWLTAQYVAGAAILFASRTAWRRF